MYVFDAQLFLVEFYSWKIETTITVYVRKKHSTLNFESVVKNSTDMIG